MKLKDAVSKIIAPGLAEYGFVLAYQDSRYYQMKNAEAGLLISLTVPPRCPFELLGEYLQRREQKQQGDKEMKKVAFVTLGYSFKRTDGGYVNLSPYMFEPSMGLMGDFIYCNGKELEEKVFRMLNETTAIVIPFLERLKNRYVGFDIAEELDDMLARGPEALAQRATEKFRLPAGRLAGYKLIEPTLFSLRGQDEEQWRARFYQNIEDIAALAAYLSQCIAARAVSTEWVWETTPEIQTCDGLFPGTRELYFSVRGKNRSLDLRFSQIFQDLWNYYPEIKCRHIPDIIETMK